MTLQGRREFSFIIILYPVTEVQFQCLFLGGNPSNQIANNFQNTNKVYFRAKILKSNVVLLMTRIWRKEPRYVRVQQRLSLLLMG